MKVYLAGPYSWKEAIKEYARQLEAEDIIVTSRWLEEPHNPTIGMKDLTEDQHRTYAYQDVEDVRAADLLVFFTDPSKTIVRAGRHVEFGMAVERGMPIYVLGDRENIFHHLPNCHHFENWEQVKTSLTLFDCATNPLV